MPANIDRVDISSKQFLRKIVLIKDSISPSQRALVLAGKDKGKRKLHPVAGHEVPEVE